MSDRIPRRNQMQQWCEAEHKIQDAVDAIERMGADLRLTDAVVLLGAARDRVADFVESVEGRRTVLGFPTVTADDIRAVRQFIRNSGGLPDEDVEDAAAIFLARRVGASQRREDAT